MRRHITTLIAAMLMTLAAGAQTITGRVVTVYDGDTFTLLRDDMTQLKIRINGIDAPEKSQAYGRRSKEYLASLIASRRVTARVCSTDRYGRLICRVKHNGKDISLEMIRSGYAWHYSHFDNTPEYARAEKEAREAHRGLWADPHPMNPYEYRRTTK